MKCKHSETIPVYSLLLPLDFQLASANCRCFLTRSVKVTMKKHHYMHFNVSSRFLHKKHNRTEMYNYK
jgi:hypothetical protein